MSEDYLWKQVLKFTIERGYQHINHMPESLLAGDIYWHGFEGFKGYINARLFDPEENYEDVRLSKVESYLLVPIFQPIWAMSSSPDPVLKVARYVLQDVYSRMAIDPMVAMPPDDVPLDKFYLANVLCLTYKRKL